MKNITFIPKYQGVKNSSINGYTLNPGAEAADSAAGGTPISINPFRPQIIPFSFQAPCDPGGLVTILYDPNIHPTFELFNHSNNFSSAHINFKVNAVIRHKNIKQMCMELKGGIAIDSINNVAEEDKFELEFTYSQTTANPESFLINLDPMSVEGINIPFLLPSIASISSDNFPSPYNSYDEAFDDGTPPTCIFTLRHAYAASKISTTLKPLISGFITIF
tara:strand:+ start:1082 stop:1741 length:660 start_codon:yes stop_codon:yes gene_type:complete